MHHVPAAPAPTSPAVPAAPAIHVSSRAGRPVPPLIVGTALRFAPIGLDVKQTEAVATLFDDGERGTLVAGPEPGAIPILLAPTTPDGERQFLRHSGEITVLVDFEDLPGGANLTDFVLCSERMWQHIAERGMQVVYVKLQVHDPSVYARLNALPNQFHVLSCPMLLGGSRFHITTQRDLEGDALFRRILRANPAPRYDCDWIWIGGPNSMDRRRVLPALAAYTQRPRRFVVSRGGHASATVATVPFPEYLEQHRRSKVCLSLNGSGPWCLKDGELLALDCFDLRQAFRAATLNPLTPKHGIHWVLFHDEEVVDAIDYYVHHDAERDRIRHNGHRLMREVLLERTWARYYLERFAAFRRTRDRAAFGELAIG